MDYNEDRLYKAMFARTIKYGKKKGKIEMNEYYAKDSQLPRLFEDNADSELRYLTPMLVIKDIVTVKEDQIIHEGSIGQHTIEAGSKYFTMEGKPYLLEADGYMQSSLVLKVTNLSTNIEEVINMDEMCIDTWKELIKGLYGSELDYYELDDDDYCDLSDDYECNDDYWYQKYIELEEKYEELTEEAYDKDDN